MAQAPAYNREKNFADDFGNETDHSSLNAELDRASNSINDIRFNLAILQADDGKLRPSVVTADSISEELRVSLVEGVVMDAQSMLDRSLAAADASSASAKEAKASEDAAATSASSASLSAKSAEENAKAISLAVNADWEATEGKAQILNKPEFSQVATTGLYNDLNGKPDNLATLEEIFDLREELARKGVPVGTIEYFAMDTPPAGYLKADGAAVGRETYPELFAAIGTTYGEGDGSTTFNLPDLIDRFAEGSATPGQKIEAGLPDIEGEIGNTLYSSGDNGAFRRVSTMEYGGGMNTATGGYYTFKASDSNPIYGATDTVQPPALTLLPCIKAFDAATNPGLIDVTELAQEVADKAAIDLSNTNPDQSFKDRVLDWMIPDYSAGITVTAAQIEAGYTAPSIGVLYVSGMVKDPKINGSIIGLTRFYTPGNEAFFYPMPFFMKSGDVFVGSFEGSVQSRHMSAYFFPVAGGVNHAN